MKPFDATGAFSSTLRDDGSLRRAAVRGAGVTVLAQFLAFAVQLIATMVLARILVPSDFGIVTMVTTFSILIASCGQIGFPDAVLHREELNHRLASNVFWINLAIGFVLMLGFAATGPVLVKLYGDPTLGHIVYGLSLTILLNNTSVVHTALLKRGMRFAAASAGDIAARMFSVVVSVVMGFTGFGYWALVAGAVAYPLGQTVGGFILCPWMPSLPRRTEGTGFMVRFAAHVYARWSVSYFTQNADNFLVGWRFGSVALGLYKKAYDLFVLPFNLLTVYPVAVSTLSRLNKEREQYQRYLLRGMSVLALVGMAISADLTLVGKDLIRVMLGPQWGTAGRIFTLFGPGVGAMLIYSSYGMIHLSIGTTARYFRWSVLEFVVRVTGFIVALRWGAEGIAVSWTVSYWLLLLPAFWYAGKPIELSVGRVTGAIWRSVSASAVAGVLTWLALHGLTLLITPSGTVTALARIVLTSSVFLVLYAAAILVLHGSWVPLIQLAKLVREMLPTSRFSKKPEVVQDAGSGMGSVAVHSPTSTETEEVI